MMSRPPTRPRLAIAAALGLALVLGAAGAALATSFVRGGHALTALKVITSDYATQSLHGGWSNVLAESTSNVPMEVTMVVPKSQQGLFLATVSGEFSAYGGDPCQLRLLIDENVMVPGPVTANSTTASVATSMQWLAGPWPPGSYRFTLQSSGGCTFGARTLSVLRSKV